MVAGQDAERMDSAERFGSMVRQERLARGLSLRDLAQRIGVSPTYVSLIERGKTSLPTEERVRAIAFELKIDADVLLAAAGQVPDDVVRILLSDPVRLCALIREKS